MKIGVIGAGQISAACVMALAMQPCARDIIVVDKNQQKSQTIVFDTQHVASLFSSVRITVGDYSDLNEAVLIIIAIDANGKEKQTIFNSNVKTYKEIIPIIFTVAPMANILVLNDPPDLLADLARGYTGNGKVLSIGTFADTLRFRYRLAQQFKVNPNCVDAYVIGEHGASSTLVWSLANIGGVPVDDLLQQQGINQQNFHEIVAHEIHCASVVGIEDNSDSYSKGALAARIAEIILKDQQIVMPIGSYQEKYGVTLSLPAQLGWTGVSAVYEPHLSIEERCALQKSADILKQALLNLD